MTDTSGPAPEVPCAATRSYRRDRQGRALPEGVVRLAQPAMPPAPLRVRLKTSPIVRRMLPTWLVLARAEAKGRRLWREHEPTRAYAIRAMETIVAGTPRESELEDIARRFVLEREAWNALFWQPWPPGIVEDASRDRIVAALDSGRGAIYSPCHLGPYFNTAGTLLSLGIETRVVAGDWWYVPPSHDYWGRRLAHWSRSIPDIPVVRARRTFRTLSTVLREGHPVLVYFDLPGPHETRFLGKRAMLADGTARLAVATGAPVVPLRSVRRGRDVVLDAAEPLDPAVLTSVDELHDALARKHEAWILEDPAAMCDPAEFGWGQAAGPKTWSCPERGQTVASA